MDTMQAFARGSASRGQELMVFDWDRAAQLIRERKPKVASAGLTGDWEYTGGEIYSDGKPTLKSYTYLASSWATPELDMDGEVIDCFVMQGKTGWDSGTTWPDSAKAILKGK